MMIDRLDAMDSPVIPQRTVTQQDIKVSPVQNNNIPVQTSQKDNQQSQTGEIKKEKVEQVVKSLNDFLQPAQTSLHFKFHEKLHEYYVTIVDDKTNEVIKEIPAKKLLDTYAAMAERLGFLVDRKV